ncbi:hypothetical protein PPYR_04954 [Photinus pyralis]|uniref:Uncharacterized protein n=1 Tax=Photinus pyralis TaxID=7054 RepID=A0A5N4AZT4_PHOPY|nr:hypothetical protein PPYR_04954 [Photinus pyralis]
MRECEIPLLFVEETPKHAEGHINIKSNHTDNTYQKQGKVKPACISSSTCTKLKQVNYTFMRKLHCDAYYIQLVFLFTSYIIIVDVSETPNQRQFVKITIAFQ